MPSTNFQSLSHSWLSFKLRGNVWVCSYVLQIEGPFLFLWRLISRKRQNICGWLQGILSLFSSTSNRFPSLITANNQDENPRSCGICCYKNIIPLFHCSSDYILLHLIKFNSDKTPASIIFLVIPKPNILILKSIV